MHIPQISRFWSKRNPMRAHTTGPHRQEPGAKNGLVASATNPRNPTPPTPSPNRRPAGSSRRWRACRVRPEANRSPPRPRSSPAHPHSLRIGAIHRATGCAQCPMKIVTDRERWGVRVLVRLGRVEGLVVGMGVRRARGPESSASSKEGLDLLFRRLRHSRVREQQDRTRK